MLKRDEAMNAVCEREDCEEIYGSRPVRCTRCRGPAAETALAVAWHLGPCPTTKGRKSMTALERLEHMLDDKDEQIGELQGKLDAAERELEHEAGWCRHVVYEDPAKAPNPELPVPRLEIRWRESESGRHDSEAIYSLVYRHLVDHIVFVPLGMTGSSGALADRIRGHVIETPFRDGCHFANEMRQLKLPGFIIAGDRVYEAKLCSKCGRLEETHRRVPFGERCTMEP